MIPRREPLLIAAVTALSLLSAVGLCIAGGTNTIGASLKMPPEKVSVLMAGDKIGGASAIETLPTLLQGAMGGNVVPRQEQALGGIIERPVSEKKRATVLSQ